MDQARTLNQWQSILYKERNGITATEQYNGIKREMDKENQQQQEINNKLSTV